MQFHSNMSCDDSGLGDAAEHKWAKLTAGGVCAVTYASYLHSTDQLYLQLCIPLGISGFWLKHEVTLRVNTRPIATMYYAHSFDMPQTTATLIMFCMTTILL